MPNVSRKLNVKVVSDLQGFTMKGVKQEISGVTAAAKTGAKQQQVYYELLKKPGADAKGGYGGFLKDLNSSFGKRSDLGKTLKLMAGAGAVGALGMVAGEFDELTKKGEEFYLSVVKGKGDARELGVEFLKSIPIVGKLGDGLSRVWGIITGETAAVAKLTEATASTDRVTDAMRARFELVEAITKRTGENIADWKRQMDRMGREGLNLKLFDINAAAAKRMEGIQKDQAAVKDTPQYKTLQTKLAEAKKAEDAALDMVRNSIAPVKNAPVGSMDWIAYIARKKQWDERQAALTEATNAKKIIEGQIRIANDAAKQGAGKEALVSEQWAWRERIAAGKEWALTWVKQTILDPLKKVDEIAEEHRKSLHEEMVAIQHEAEDAGDPDAARLRKLRADRADPSDIARAKAAMQKKRDVEEGIARLKEVAADEATASKRYFEEAEKQYQHHVERASAIRDSLDHAPRGHRWATALH